MSCKNLFLIIIIFIPLLASSPTLERRPFLSQACSCQAHFCDRKRTELHKLSSASSTGPNSLKPSFPRGLNQHSQGEPFLSPPSLLSFILAILLSRQVEQIHGTVSSSFFIEGFNSFQRRHLVTISYPTSPCNFFS